MDDNIKDAMELYRDIKKEVERDLIGGVIPSNHFHAYYTSMQVAEQFNGFIYYVKFKLNGKEYSISSDIKQEDTFSYKDLYDLLVESLSKAIAEKVAKDIIELERK